MLNLDLNIDINKDNNTSININKGAIDIAEEEELRVVGNSKPNCSPIQIDDFNEINDNINDHSIYKVRKKLQEVKIDQVCLNIIVWNLQVLNVDNVERRKKKQFIMDILAEIQPDLIFLIDVGKMGKELNIPNYICYTDGRNYLYKIASIQDNILQADGVFFIPTLDINFAYVRPNESNKMLLNYVIDLLKKDCTVIGDLNLKSNKVLNDLCMDKQLLGEMTLQTIVVKKNLKNTSVELFDGLSDHKGLFIKIERKVAHNAGKKLIKFNKIEVDKIIQDLFDKGDTNVKVKVKPVVGLRTFDDSDDFTNRILQAVIENDSAFQYKIYNRLWKFNKKEPFLGTWIPKQVVDSLANHYWNNQNKEYKDIPNVKIDYNLLECKKKSYSEAACMENIALADVDTALDSIWTDIVKEGKQDLAIKNFLKACDKVKRDLSFQTFFLKKSKDRLEDVNDIRIISIVPLFIKVWESLIYNVVVEYITEYINHDVKYQYGGVLSGSTFECIYRAQQAYRNNDSKGMLFADISKGYDSVNWRILEEDIELLDWKVANLLKVWLTLICNCNANINDGTIYKGRGLGMGLSLAPAMFVFYVHIGLIKSGIELKKTIMYVDDLTITIEDTQNSLENVRTLISVFKHRGLEINPKKCSILSEDKGIKNRFRILDIEFVSRQKYLGVTLRINTSNNIIADNRIFKFNKSNISIPKFIAIGLKRRIYEGAILAKLRYSCMMLALKNKIEREYFWRNLYFIYKQDYYKLSYMQVVLFSNNWFRLFFDLYDLEQIKLLSKDIPMMDKRCDFVIDFIKKRLVSGISQIDDPIKNLWFIVDDPLIWNINMEFLKEFVNRIYIEAKKCYMEYWKKEKLKNKIRICENMDIWIESKLFKNFKVIQNIILRHFPDNITWVSFIVMVFSQLNLRIKLGQNIVQNFIEVKLFMWNKNDKVDLIKWLDIAYLKLDEYSNNILNFCMDNSDNYRNVAIILYIVDYISMNNVWKNKTTNDLIYFLNLKLDLKDYVRDRYVDLLTKEIECYFHEITSSIFYLNNVIAVDGSFSNKTNMIGSGIYCRYWSDSVINEEFYYSTIVTGYSGRNIVGEIFACIKAIEIAINKKWKYVNIVFDYIGLVYFALGLWTCNTKLSMAYRNAFKKLSKKIDVIWYKVKSHTNVSENEYADKLSKLGAGLVVDCPKALVLGQTKEL